MEGYRCSFVTLPEPLISSTLLPSAITKIAVGRGRPKFGPALAARLKPIREIPSLSINSAGSRTTLKLITFRRCTSATDPFLTTTATHLKPRPHPAMLCSITREGTFIAIIKTVQAAPTTPGARPLAKNFPTALTDLSPAGAYKR